MTECPVCNKEFKNLGSHIFHAHKKDLPEESMVVDEYIQEKPLSDLISQLRQILKQYQSSLTVTTVEKNGTVSEIQISARIQTGR